MKLKLILKNDTLNWKFKLEQNYFSLLLSLYSGGNLHKTDINFSQFTKTYVSLCIKFT